MPLKIAICDDSSDDRNQLISLIKSKDLYYECTAYTSGENLLWDIEKGTHFDIFFLDIYMKNINGIETAKQIRAIDQDALLIFISSSNAFYRESYDLYAFNYLIKPLTDDKVTEVLRHALIHLDKYANQVVRFSFDNYLHTINCSQLLYLTSNRHLVYFIQANEKTLKSYGKIDDFISQLSSEFFVRCHQSYIVNLKHVTGVTASEFILGNVRIPISRKFSQQSREKYRIMMFGDF